MGDQWLAGKLDATEAQKRIWVLDRMRAGGADMALERIESRLEQMANVSGQTTRLYYGGDEEPDRPLISSH